MTMIGRANKSYSASISGKPEERKKISIIRSKESGPRKCKNCKNSFVSFLNMYSVLPQHVVHLCLFINIAYNAISYSKKQYFERMKRNSVKA